MKEADWRAWQNDGYLRLGRIADLSVLQQLRSRIDALMLGEVPTEGIYFQLDSDTGNYSDLKFSDGKWTIPTLAYRKIELLENDPLFRNYIQHPHFQSIAKRIIGEEVSIYRAMFMNKPAGKGTELPYHQDAGLQWQLDRDPVMTVWTALDPATRDNGCIEVIPGSHKLGLLSEFGHTISPEQEERCSKMGSVFLEAEMGEVILLHNLLLHRSGINPTDAPRRAFSVCYMDSATRDISGKGRQFPVVFSSQDESSH